LDWWVLGSVNSDIYYRDHLCLIQVCGLLGCLLVLLCSPDLVVLYHKIRAVYARISKEGCGIRFVHLLLLEVSTAM
jgi:hypothetical protein